MLYKNEIDKMEESSQVHFYHRFSTYAMETTKFLKYIKIQILKENSNGILNI